MNLYLITRWGNNGLPDAANGEDTHLIVAASTLEEAVDLAEAVFCKLPHENVFPFANVVVELGRASKQGIGKAEVLLGPVIQWNILEAGWHTWVRHYPPEGDWMEA